MKHAWVLFLLLVPALAGAQEAVKSPHGDLDFACEACHSAAGWKPVSLDRFDHSTTGFPIEHAHTGLECADCHGSLEFGTVEGECAACHRDVHLGELGLDCSRCHTTRTFIDTARHRALHRETVFPLTGAHAGEDCQACHEPQPLGDLQYLGTPSECYDCHRAEFESTTDPDHVADGFIEDCAACHGTATWENGFFNHEIQLAGSSLVCVDCHQDDYDRARRPDHAAAMFPLDCERCHNTRSWYGSYYEHDRDYFPIYNGRHADEWNECNECHPSYTDFAVFTCLTCHPHSDKPKTDEVHKEEDGYIYDSIECLRCHENGR